MPKQLCKCSHCGEKISRWLINPNTKQPIKNFFCSKSCKGLWQIAQRELLGFTKEWLIDQYINQGKDANQIGREIGRDGKSVWNWLSLYKIKTRPRGGFTLPHAFKKGQENLFKGKNHSQETRDKLSKIAISDGRLPWGKNNDPYWRGKTGKDHPSFKGGFTPERQAVYSSKEWVDAVKIVWERDGAICQHCNKHHNSAKVRGTFHIHHIVSFQIKELRTEPSNLVLLCKECHNFVHSKKNITKIFIKEPPC